MTRQKSLLKTMSVRESGKQHPCRSNKKHPLAKGEVMLVIKEGQDERHYCRECGAKFMAIAHEKLHELALLLQLSGEDDATVSPVNA